MREIAWPLLFPDNIPPLAHPLVWYTTEIHILKWFSILSTGYGSHFK